jgi:hypothetical protein
MDLREYAKTETTGLVERLLSKAEEAERQLRAEADREITDLRAQAEALQAEIAAQAERAAALEADLDAVIEAHRHVEADRASVEAARVEEAAARAQAEAEIRSTRERLDEAQAEADRQAALFAEEAALAREAMTGRETQLVAEQAERLRLEEELRTVQELLDASHRHHEQQGEVIGQLREQLGAAEALAATTLADAVRATAALDSAATVSDLFSGLVKQLATELPRTALFRVKDSHLVGEHAAGLDPGVDIAKLMIPMAVDSLLTRAVPQSGVVRADGVQLADLFRPFSGTAASGIAVPVMFQGQPLAVLYGEADGTATQAQATLALLLASHAGVLLSRLAQELKALKELREYAAMLLQEAEQMFLSDTAAARPEGECVRRLQETIECGRQLYAQRAALEGTIAAGLLDEQIAAIISAAATPFAAALAAATAEVAEAHRTAS